MRLLPFPVLSGALALSWLALGGISVAQAVLALVLAVLIPWLCAPFLQTLPTIRSTRAALRLLARVAWDIVVANIAVARLILGPMQRLRPAFIDVPLDLTHTHAITLLASIITMTPGTVSLALDPDARILRLHALDAADPAMMVATIKSRYESLLMEILEC